MIAYCNSWAARDRVATLHTVLLVVHHSYHALLQIAICRVVPFQFTVSALICQGRNALQSCFSQPCQIHCIEAENYSKRAAGSAHLHDWASPTDSSEKKKVQMSQREYNVQLFRPINLISNDGRMIFFFGFSS